MPKIPGWAPKTAQFKIDSRIWTPKVAKKCFGKNVHPPTLNKKFTPLVSGIFPTFTIFHYSFIDCPLRQAHFLLVITVK